MSETQDKSRKPTVGTPFTVEIGSIDQPSLKVTAQFNPKELTVDKSVPWTKKEKTYAEKVQLEFTGAEARTLTMELLFDGYEQDQGVEPQLLALTKLASAIEDPSKSKAKEERKRPHHVVVAWGQAKGQDAAGDGKMLPFKGVIESLQTKMTMFSPSGVILRATCNVKFKEADSVSLKKKA
jgi:hypothetical protein